jgi:hypothetical protein
MTAMMKNHESYNRRQHREPDPKWAENAESKSARGLTEGQVRTNGLIDAGHHAKKSG